MVHVVIMLTVNYMLRLCGKVCNKTAAVCIIFLIVRENVTLQTMVYT